MISVAMPPAPNRITGPNRRSSNTPSRSSCAFGHTIIGCTVKPWSRASGRGSCHARDHGLGGGARLGRGGEPKPHAANVGFVGDVLRQHLDRERRRLLEQGERDLLHLLRRGRHAGRHRGNAVSRKHGLRLRLREQRALGSRRRPHRVERGLAIDAGEVSFARRRPHQGRLRLGVLPEKAEAFDRISRRLIGGDARRLELGPRAGGGLRAKPIGEDRRHAGIVLDAGRRRRSPLPPHRSKRRAPWGSSSPEWRWRERISSTASMVAA